MALAFQSGDSIKQALLEELQNILSPDKETRVNAESKMKHLEITEGYGVYLAEIIMNQSFDLALRQLACVMLNKYVEEHWSVPESVANDQAKQMIRKILPNGLYDPNSKIRATVAYTISTIASVDWPHTWTDLFDIIVKCLGGNEDSIHGAMQVLVEFTYDLECQISVVCPIILQEIYRIFQSEQVYSIHTRSCSVKIFKSLLKAINDHIETKEEKAKLLDPVLPIFIDKLIGSLNVSTGYELKIEIIKVLTYMANEMPKFIQQYNSQILPPIWQLLTQTADIYVKVLVNESDKSLFEDDTDDEAFNNFSILILQLIEFIHSIVEKKIFRNTVKSVLTDLIYIAIVFMQITEEQIQKWADDAESYVDDYNFDNSESTIRASSTDILLNISDDFSAKSYLPALSQAIERHINVAQAEKAAENPNWWKILESSITAVGTLKQFIIANMDDSKFNLKQFLSFVQTQLGRGADGSGYQQDVSPYLHSKCLWVLARYSNTSVDIYDRQTLQGIIHCVSNNLQMDKTIHVQIAAMRALYELCRELRGATPEQRAMVIDKLPMFLNFITVIAPCAKNNIMSELLLTISVVTSFDEGFTAANHVKILPFTTAILLKSFDDPFILEQVQEILQVLAGNTGCIATLQEKLVPTLVSILNLEDRVAHDTKGVMQDTTLDILQTIIRHSPKPLSSVLVNTAFPATVHCILRTDDHAIMQSGGECLRAFINASPEQICSYNNGDGLNYIMQVTTMLLNPMSSEFTAAFVGRLVITIVMKAGNFLGENIHLLLKAVISKMQLVETLSVAMSLVMTFAHLVVTQLEPVLNFLSTVPGPTGEPAIQFVLSNWLTRQTLFYGSYERKVSAMALCKLFEYGITTGDTRLTSVTIRELVEDSLIPNRVRTRAQSTGTQQWVAIPVMVKIFKLLLNELANFKEANMTLNDSDGLSDDDEEDAIDNSLGDTSNYIRTSDLWFDGDDDEEGEQLLQDLMQDPIFQSSMEDNLTKFLQNFSQSEHFPDYLNQLTDNEKIILRSIQVNV